MKTPADITEAREIQRGLREKIRIVPLLKEPGYIAGVDAAFSGNNIIAVASLFSYPDLVAIGDRHIVTEVHFPYIPGYLSFREGPALLRVINKLKIRPDLIIFDGQGIAHPAGVGIASHIGVILGIPSIGCAKSRLVGEYTEPGRKKGAQSILSYKKRAVGAVLRSRTDVRPLFISPGHLINIEDAVNIVIKCLGRFRLPEPVRRADLLTKKLKT